MLDRTSTIWYVNIYNMRQSNTEVNNDNFYFMVNWVKHNINTHYILYLGTLFASHHQSLN